MAISGNTVVIGASQEGLSDAGAAYVFVRSGTSWAEQAHLTIPSGFGYRNFGASVAIAGSTILVGEPGSVSAFNFHGAAYVFAPSGGTWILRAKLAASDGRAGDFFGSSVDISGTTAVIGAPGNDGRGQQLDTEGAHVFTQSGPAWRQQAKLTGPYGDFGSAVTASGDTAIVGSTRASGNAAYVFDRSGTVWTQQTTLTGIGAFLDLPGSTLLAGRQQPARG